MTEQRGIAIRIQALKKSFRGVPVLTGVDLDIEAGEIMVIVGGSGEGKSVLLRHIAGLETPDAGTLRLNGTDLRQYLQLSAEEKPFQLSMVFQSSALLNSLSVAENVSLRLKEHRSHSAREIRAIVARCLEQVDLAGTENKMPSELSGGMRKRVAIARALAVEPQLILYDEPTADLDPILTVQIGELIKRIRDRRATTQVVVAHDLALASDIGTHIAVLRGGHIIDYQPAKAFAQSDNAYTQEFIRAAHLQV
ncbi:MAG TPA: ATP-binding cassette domain-containing protein [Candidatus Acidoferrales bacterium]|nr:ATP-binding cassette domain-containing protein [Candidatus Acidoferrales bacterium]